MLGGYRVTKGKKKFAWIDGTEFKYERWAPNEPDTLDHVNYHCFSAYADDNFFWYDHNCATPNSQLCQKSATVAKCGCPVGWFQYGNKCFFVNNDKATNAEYVEYCNELNAEPASIHSPEEEEFLKKITKPGNYYWIGAYRIGKGNKTFEWRDGTEYRYEHWASGQPDGLNSPNDLCVAVWVDPKFLWYDENCNLPKYQLCQKILNATDKPTRKFQT
ncbi:galactose-specific lectin nattectin-like protein, partial [Leptotrombidium deliense]